MKVHKFTNHFGMTLIEMLLVISLLIILAGMSVVQWGGFSQANKSLTEVEEIVSLLAFARNQAVFLEQPVQVKRIQKEWQQGLQIVTQDNRILHLSEQFVGAKLLTWQSSLNRDELLQFQPDGFTDGQKGTFYYCAKNNSLKDSRGIVIIETGRVRVKELESNEYSLHCVS